MTDRQRQASIGSAEPRQQVAQADVPEPDHDRAVAADALRQAADDLEAQKPHIPPSTDPQRRTRVIQRSTLNAAIRRLRAWAEAVTDE